MTARERSLELRPKPEDSIESVRSKADPDVQDHSEPSGKNPDEVPSALKPSADGDGVLYQNPAAQLDVKVGTEEKKKKRKKSKPKSQRGLNKPSGFEDYYADAPLTPEEHQEEQKLYEQSKAFEDRIQLAVQRYVARRKFDSERKDLFDKYMAFGGIDSGPKVFGGAGEQGLEDATAAQIAEARAQHHVDMDAAALSVVDFNGTLEAFISSRMPAVFELSTENQIKGNIRVIRNFLNYLLHHDVCPEYAVQIEEARRTCDMGESQLWLIQQANKLLPGNFNKACSILFGGEYQEWYIGDHEVADRLGVPTSMSHAEAATIFHGGLAAQGSDIVCQAYNDSVRNGTAKRIWSSQTFIEVLGIEFASKEVKEMYADPSLKGQSPVGKIQAATWHCSAAPPHDLTEEEEAEIEKNGHPVRKFELWIEDKVLEKIFVGMKLQVYIHELSFGVFYFDGVMAALCSFYNMIPNERLIGWRDHKYLEPRRAQEEEPIEQYNLAGGGDYD